MFNEHTGQSDQMANGNKRKLNFPRPDRKEFHFPELPFIIQSKETKRMEGTHLLHGSTDLQMSSFTKPLFVTKLTFYNVI